MSRRRMTLLVAATLAMMLAVAAPALAQEFEFEQELSQWASVEESAFTNVGQVGANQANFGDVESEAVGVQIGVGAEGEDGRASVSQDVASVAFGNAFGVSATQVNAFIQD